MKETTTVSLGEVICVGCRMHALLDEHKRCEFCRNSFRPEAKPFSWRDMPWIGFLVIAAIVGFVIAAIFFLPTKV